MAIKITGQSVFMEFEHIAETDKAAEKFIKGMLKINRDMTLRENPKPERLIKKTRYRFGYRGVLEKRENAKLDTWREANKQYRLSITIERV